MRRKSEPRMASSSCHPTSFAPDSSSILGTGACGGTTQVVHNTTGTHVPGSGGRNSFIHSFLRPLPFFGQVIQFFLPILSNTAHTGCLLTTTSSNTSTHIIHTTTKTQCTSCSLVWEWSGRGFILRHIRHAPTVLEFHACSSHGFFTAKLKVLTCLILPILLLVRLLVKTAWASWALAGAIVAVYAARAGGTQRESMLVVGGLGVQLESVLFCGVKRHNFISTPQIEDVVVNEGVTACDIFFYLAFVIKQSDKLVLPFQVYMLRLHELALVYRALHRVLQYSCSLDNSTTTKN